MDKDSQSMEKQVNSGSSTGVAEEHAVDFPWPLIRSCTIILGVDQKQSHSIQDTIASPRLRQILWGVSLLFSLISGILSLTGSCSHEETMTFLLVQAMFGAYFVLVNAARVWPKYVQRMLVATTESYPSVSFAFFAMADIVIIFCIVWFLIGHMWAYAHQYDYCNVAISGMTLATFVLHYVMAVCSFLGFLFDSSTILEWCQKQIQFRLDYLSEEHRRREETHSKILRTLAEDDTLSIV